MKIDELRANFPILNDDLVYLDNASSTQKPQEMIDSLLDFYTNQYANIHRGGYNLSLQASQMYEESREIIQKFLRAKYPEEIIFTSGTTESINLASVVLGNFKGVLESGWKLEKGDQIILTEMEHHANLIPWQILAKERELEIKFIPVKKNGDLGLEIYDKLLNPKVKIVAFTHVSNTLGTVNPAKEITQKAHDYGSLVLIDGAQAVSHLEINFSDINPDFYCFSGHKLFGPTGIGVLYGKKELLEKLPPYKTGGDMIENVTFTTATFSPPPSKFEAGTPNISGAIGLGTAIKYFQKISQRIIETEKNSYENLKVYEKSLLQYATKKLWEIKNLRIIGEAKEKIAVISFVIEGIHPNDLGVFLDQKNICTRSGQHCTQPLLQKLNLTGGTNRISLAFYNTFEEIDKLIEVINKALKILTN